MIQPRHLRDKPPQVAKAVIATSYDTGQANRVATESSMATTISSS